MKLIISYFLLLFSTHVFCQDSFPDLHGDKETFDKVKNKTLQSELATFTDAGSKLKKNNIKLTKIPLKNYSSTYSFFASDSVKFKIIIGKFNRTIHKIGYINGEVYKIDNESFYGTDGEIPKNQINSISVIIGSDTIKIPKIAYDDLYEPNLTWKEGSETVGTLRIYSSIDRKRFYIYMGNSDGAGFYEATLIIRDKKYIGRVVDSGF
jgi:hypothetical protein